MSSAYALRSGALLLALLAEASTAALAQKAFGVRAGATFSSYRMTGDLDESFDGGGGVGYYAELDFSLPLGSSGLSVMPLVGYNIQQTASYSTEASADLNFPIATVVVDEARDEMSSLVIAALLRYQIPGKTISPYFELGPYAKFNLGGTHFAEGEQLLRVSENQVAFSSFDIEDDIEFGTSSSDVYKPSNFTFALGAGLAMNLEFGTLSIGARYIGIGDVRGPESPGGPYGLVEGAQLQDGSVVFREYGDSDKLRLRTLELTVGFAIPLGGY